MRKEDVKPGQRVQYDGTSARGTVLRVENGAYSVFADFGPEQGEVVVRPDEISLISEP